MTSSAGDRDVNQVSSDEPLVTIVRLGQDGFLLAKLDREPPSGEYNIAVDVRFAPPGEDGNTQLCAVKNNPCPGLVALQE